MRHNSPNFAITEADFAEMRRHIVEQLPPVRVPPVWRDVERVQEATARRLALVLAAIQRMGQDGPDE